MHFQNFHIIKSEVIPLPPQNPYQTQRSWIPHSRRTFTANFSNQPVDQSLNAQTFEGFELSVGYDEDVVLEIILWMDVYDQ